MVKNLFRAIRLEFNFLRQSKLTLLLSFILPFIFTLLFGFAGQINVSWKVGTTYFVLYASSVLPLFVLFISTQLSTLRIVGERAPYGTLDRDLLSLSRTNTFFGKFIVNCLIAIIQALIVVILSLYVFHLSVDPLAFAFIITLIAICGVSLGLFVSSFALNKEQAIQIIPFIILLLFIFNGSIINLDAIASPINKILSSLPLATATNALTRMISSQQILLDFKDNIIFLLLGILILIFIGWIKFYLEGFKK